MTEWSGVKVYFEYSQFSKSVKKTQKLYEWLCKFCSIWIKRQITCDHSEVPKEPPVPGSSWGQEGQWDKQALSAGEKEDQEPWLLLTAVPYRFPPHSSPLLSPPVPLGRWKWLEPVLAWHIGSLCCRVIYVSLALSRCPGLRHSWPILFKVVTPLCVTVCSVQMPQGPENCPYWGNSLWELWCLCVLIWSFWSYFLLSFPTQKNQPVVDYGGRKAGPIVDSGKLGRGQIVLVEGLGDREMQGWPCWPLEVVGWITR